MAHGRQSRQDFGLGFLVEIFQSFKFFPLRAAADLARADEEDAGTLHRPGGNPGANGWFL